MEATVLKRAEVRIQQLNRVYAVMSGVNQTIVREKDPRVMLEAICRIAVEVGKFRMAWFGMIDSLTQALQPAASSGIVEGYLSAVRIDLRDAAQSMGPTALCLQSGEHAICSDIANDPLYLPWREEALRRGYRSSGAFPIKLEGRVIGVLNLYANEPEFFDPEELRLLDEMGEDISFALEVIHRERERQKADDELRWKTAFLEALVDSATDGILVVDNQGKSILQNQRMIEMWNIPPHISGKTDDTAQLQFATQKTKDPREFAEKVAHLYANPDEISRDVVELVDGTILDRSSSPVLDKSGNHYGRIWVFRDVTKQRQLEEQFRHAQKMEAFGQLAGGVAHDFNNTLTAIIMLAALAATDTNLKKETREVLDNIQSVSERAASFTGQLLAFSRRRVMRLCQLDLNEIVTSLAKMLQRTIGEAVRLQLNLHPRPLLIRGDAGMLDQVLLNLVVNARDAMPMGGRLVIETGEVKFSVGQTTVTPDVSPGRYVSLTVTDSGSGIAPENLPRIFEPFFTTKEVGKGTGLGLATTFGVVKQHGGAIDVESEIGGGTTFRVLLPADELSVETVAAKPTQAKPHGGTETILLVEDDTNVRRATRIVLEGQGYKVLEATNGREAEQVWEQVCGHVHLLLSDIVMPDGMSGRSLAAQLKRREPELRIILTSGYSDEIAGNELVLEARQHFIPKPYDPVALLAVVRRCLDS